MNRIHRSGPIGPVIDFLSLRPDRRAPTKTGRINLLSARIPADTNNAIFGYADRREITLGEVLERATGSLLEKEPDGKGRGL